MKKMMIALLAFASLTTVAATTETLTSPNGRLKMTLTLGSDSTASYALTMDGRDVIKSSSLGIDIAHQGDVSTMQIFQNPASLQSSDLRTGLVLGVVERQTIDSTWTPVWGEVKEIRDNHNELKITFQQPKNDRFFVIRFRLFNDGLGFRYEFPRQENLNYFIIGEERTGFALPEDMTAFWIAGDYDSNEYVHQTTQVSEISKKYPDFNRENNSAAFAAPMVSVQTPVMLRANDKKLYVNIHEAALENYSSMQLALDGLTFSSNLVPDVFGTKGYIQTGAKTPWRTIVVADNARDILASKLILNLNEPCAIEDPSWITPQKFAGVWWEMFAPGKGSWAFGNSPNVKIDSTDFAALTPSGRHAANTANVKKYIDFASANGIQGVLVEGWNIGWEDWIGKYKEYVFDFVTPYPDFNVVELREYAKSKGVRLVMHHETSGSASNYERHMDKAYQFMVDNNYNTVKSGYVGPIIPRGEHHYGQTMVNHYLLAIRKAADYKIMVSAHEPVRPTGMHRTYPNYLAAESARGTEFESFASWGNPADHTLILPFTRLMGGPMDYTPGIFEGEFAKAYNPNATTSIHTTLIKQMALYVTLYSPLQMVADMPENYARFDDAFQFIRDVAVDWDDTKILEAEVGDYITTARKAKGTDNWFIGGITDENPRVSEITLDFLDPKTNYEATIYADGDDAHYITNPKSYKITKQKVTSKTKLKLKLAASGGYAISIKKAAK